MEESSMLKLGFIGAGKVGTALATLLNGKGYQVAAVSSRSSSSAENLAKSVDDCKVYNDNQSVADAATFIFITTPDDVIQEVASQAQWHPGQSVIHCSGAASTDILEHAREAGAMVGSLHPLQTFAGVQQAIENIPGSTFAAEAEKPLLGVLEELVTALDGQFIELQASDKVAYHAAAVIACNYLVTLVKLATDLWQTFSVPKEQAVHALLPLIQGTLNNIDKMGIPQCLTGPIARGDTGTIRKHIDALSKVAPDLLPAYKELGLQTIPVSIAKGKITESQAEELEALLKTD